MTPVDFERVPNLCKETAEKTFVRTKQTHLEKLEKLTRKKGPINLRPEGLERWLVNQTTVRLTKHQEEVLQLGLKFVPTPRRIPVKDFVAAVETATTTLDVNEADDLRMRTCGILRKAMPPPTSNLSKQQKTAIDELRQMEGVVILPADKGNAKALMTREEYDGKLEGLPNTDTYKVLKKDPTAAQ